LGDPVFTRMPKTNLNELNNWLQNEFNNLLGSNITHIANAYSNADSVSVAFHREQLAINKILANLKSAGALLKTKEITSVVDLPHGKCHVERRNTSWKYLTVVAKNRDGSSTLICWNNTIPANRSYIANNNGGITESGYGKSVWEDVNGISHNKPSSGPKLEPKPEPDPKPNQFLRTTSGFKIEKGSGSADRVSGLNISGSGQVEVCGKYYFWGMLLKYYSRTEYAFSCEPIARPGKTGKNGEKS